MVLPHYINFVNLTALDVITSLYTRLKTSLQNGGKTGL